MVKQVSIPVYRLDFRPWENWSVDKSPDWWGAYNNVKHSRNIHFEQANLLNTITALGALYIAIFELIRVY